MNPVVDYTKRDYPAVMMPNESPKKFTKVQELIYELKVSDAMSRRLITAKPDTLMSELREILRANRISGTPIVQGDQIVGIISIEDFIKWLADGGKDCRIEDKMIKNVQTLFADESLIQAVIKLERLGFGRFPVIDRDTGKLLGVITKGDIIERLLEELEIGRSDEEIHQYRASHIFEDIIADKTTMIFQYNIKGKDFNKAGEVSSGLKKTLTRLGIHPQIVRRAAIASYEAEMNVVIYADAGEMTVKVEPEQIFIDIRDIGPGIGDIKKAMELGYSTAPDWVRELGFGAGMGLNNIQKCADIMKLKSKVGKGTHLKIGINMK